MKAIINNANYESYWVDYLDGKLSVDNEEALFAFLENNPEIASNLIDADDFKLPALEVTYPGKNLLKAENQIENLLIAKLENQISDNDNKMISEKIINDADIAESWEVYQKTILVADKNVVFPGKKYLKKTISIPWYGYASSVAAAVILVVVTGWLLNGTQIGVAPANKPQFSEINVPARIIDSLQNLNTDNQQNFANQTNEKENSSNSANNNFTIQPSEIIIMVTKESIPERIPVASLNIKEVKTQDDYIFMEYRNDIPVENDGFEYSMQYIKAPKENKIKTTINKVIDFSKELDIKGSYEKLKIAKEDLLFSSND
ncbi:MAG: hypothetical protein PHE56_03145 [Bacteroidales bacterium]|nr:hypothetical protein [Bacteroidales bacterium]